MCFISICGRGHSMITFDPLRNGLIPIGDNSEVNIMMKNTLENSSAPVLSMYVICALYQYVGVVIS